MFHRLQETINYGVQRSKVSTEVCLHFDSDMITEVVFNIYSFHILYLDAGWLEECTYTFWSLEKGQGHNQKSNCHNDRPLAGPFLNLSVF